MGKVYIKNMRTEKIDEGGVFLHVIYSNGSTYKIALPFTENPIEIARRLSCVVAEILMQIQR